MTPREQIEAWDLAVLAWEVSERAPLRVFGIRAMTLYYRLAFRIHPEWASPWMVAFGGPL